MIRGRDYVTASRLIGRVAAKYARKLQRRDLEDDLASAAWVEVLQSAGAYDAARGTWDSFVLTVASRVVRRQSRVMRAPVSGNEWRAHRWGEGLAAVGDEALAQEVDAPTTATRPPAPDDAAIGAEFVEAVRAALMDLPGAELALGVMLDGETPQAVARTFNVSHERVLRAVRDARAEARAQLSHFAPRSLNVCDQE